MTQKSQALAQSAMKLGQAIYETQQAGGAAGAAGAETASADAGDAGAAEQEEVVDAEFSEVDDEKKA